MTSKIFKSILSVVLAVLLASLVISTGVMYRYFDGVQVSQLKDELNIAAKAANELGESYLKNLESDRFRLTHIGADGKVIFDSHADIVSMENHSGREEIQEALLYGKGSSSRYSSTLMEQTLYEAVRLNDGSVLRISVSRASVFLIILGMLQPIALVLVIAICLSVWLARRMAKRIVEPLNCLDLENPMENDAYEELSPLLHRIHAQHQEIRMQMQALNQRQNEFEQITGNMKEALILLDGKGRILSINPAAKALYEVDELCIGDDFLAIDRKADMRHAISDAAECGQAYFRSKKNGRDYQFDLSRIDSEDKMQGLVILAFDITEQLNGEKHRRDFTANVSHELKTPLQSIIGSAELMENGIVKAEDMPRFMGHIRKEASRLVSLIDDIIRLSQLDEGSEMPREDVELKALAGEVCESLCDAASRKNVSLDVSGDEAVIYGVRSLLYEVIYNLCDNAVKYNKEGGAVKVTLAKDAGSVKLSVSDEGIGIPSEHQEKIFERFYRVDKSHSKQSGGTGLGLSIVKHAVQYHNGKITINSEPNRGTTITVTFDMRT